MPAEQESQSQAVEDARSKNTERLLWADACIWLGEGIEGDDTDGHIDDLARFIDARTIAIGIEDEQARSELCDPAEGVPRAESARDQDGRPFEIVEMPMPRPIAYEGQRLPATYVNFYFAERRAYWCRRSANAIATRKPSGSFRSTCRSAR